MLLPRVADSNRFTKDVVKLGQPLLQTLGGPFVPKLRQSLVECLGHGFISLAARLRTARLHSCPSIEGSTALSALTQEKTKPHSDVSGVRVAVLSETKENGALSVRCVRNSFSEQRGTGCKAARQDTSLSTQNSGKPTSLLLCSMESK